MKKTIVSVLALILSLALFSTPVFAYTANENYGDMEKTTSEMSLDGLMDAVYTGALCIPVSIRSDGEPLDTPYSYAYLVWQEGDEDNDYIWCYTIVNDRWYQTGNANFYERDSVELFLDFANAGNNTDVSQHIVDAAGNCAECSLVRWNVTVNGESDKITKVTDALGNEYFSAVAHHEDTPQGEFLCVEYRVTCPKLHEDKTIGYSMTIHDFPGGAWYFCQASQPPQNWVATSYDYLTVSGSEAKADSDFVHPLRSAEQTESETNLPESTDSMMQKPSETEAPPVTDKPSDEKKGCGAVLEGVSLLLQAGVMLLLVKKASASTRVTSPRERREK